MADAHDPVSADRLALLAERLIVRFGDRAWDIACTQRNQAAGESRESWTAIADEIATQLARR